MNFTDGEKILILMLSDLYKKLEVRGEIDPDFVKSAIFNDKLWGLRWKYSGIPFKEENDPEIVGEVIDILDMWSFIEYSYQQLTEKEKSQLENDVAPFGADPKFQGFDGNNETDYMATAMFIVNELDRFVEFKGRGFNCHSPSLEMHQRMLRVYSELGKNGISEPLSVIDLVTVLNEIPHPVRRRNPRM